MSKSKKDKLKEKLYKLIDDIDDENLLNQLNEELVPYITRQMKNEALTEEERTEIEAGLKDIDQGNTITWEDLKKEMNEWKSNWIVTKYFTISKSKKEKLKEKLYQLIDDIEDERLLSQLNEDIMPYIIENSSTEDEEDDLTPEQALRLEKAIKQVKEGKTISYEDFKKRMEEWLTE